LQKEERPAPTIKQHLAALRMLFDWLVVGQVLPVNPGSCRARPQTFREKGKDAGTRGRGSAGAARFHRNRPADWLADRALIGFMVYTFARVNAVLSMRVEDFFVQGRPDWV